MKNYKDLKDKAILLGWIAGLLLITSLIWIITQQVQSYYLLRSVNNVFINNNDVRRLSAVIPLKSNKQGLNVKGFWYTMHNSTDNMFVFSAFNDGIMIPLGAVVTPDGKVSDLIPLSAHAVYVFDSLPKSILQMYVSRIEASAPVLQEGGRE
ncbi:MAG: hypothetical protein FWD26_01080 [Treponema sp.]|nr:hypothetical protein [Treponema sp.]